MEVVLDDALDITAQSHYRLEQWRLGNLANEHLPKHLLGSAGKPDSPGVRCSADRDLR
jgi:hypothetical protein